MMYEIWSGPNSGMCLQVILVASGVNKHSLDPEASSFAIQMPLPSSHTSSESKTKICMLSPPCRIMVICHKAR